MKITDALLGEHGVFYAWFDALEEMLDGIDRPDAVRTLVEPLTRALVSHARLEDELLFDELGQVIGSDVGPLAVMRAEHEEIETELERAAHASSVRQGTDALRRAIDRARVHFAKEERIVFPIAKEQMETARLSSLAEQWAARRGVVLLEAVTRSA
jgi:hemerythrin-like domain-containing protein